MTSSSGAILREPRLRITRHRRLCLSITAAMLTLSVVGVVLCWISPIGAPLKPGLDFTGGTAIQVERLCGDRCNELTVQQVQDVLPSPAVVQLLDGGQAISLRSTTLSPAQSGAIVDALETSVGPLELTDTQITTIGPVLGKQLLSSSILALSVSFIGVALYITARYARLYAVLALLALAHDVLITAGLFAWLGLLAGVEVNSLFAVALLTLAGYSVNDTVVVFDDACTHRKAESRSLACAFGGEELLEYFFADILRDSISIVRDCDENTLYALMLLRPTVDTDLTTEAISFFQLFFCFLSECIGCVGQ